MLECLNVYLYVCMCMCVQQAMCSPFTWAARGGWWGGGGGGKMEGGHQELVAFFREGHPGHGGGAGVGSMVFYT